MVALCTAPPPPDAPAARRFKRPIAALEAVCVAAPPLLGAVPAADARLTAFFAAAGGGADPPSVGRVCPAIGGLLASRPPPVLTLGLLDAAHGVGASAKRGRGRLRGPGRALGGAVSRPRSSFCVTRTGGTEGLAGPRVTRS